MVIFPSPAGGPIKPAAAGVQALTMNSPGSAWTPVLAGLRQLICRRRKNPKPKPTSYTLYRTGTKYRSGHHHDVGKLVPGPPAQPPHSPFTEPGAYGDWCFQ